MGLYGEATGNVAGQMVSFVHHELAGPCVAGQALMLCGTVKQLAISQYIAVDLSISYGSASFHRALTFDRAVSLQLDLQMVRHTTPYLLQP